MDHKISKLLGKPVLEGQVGESHVCDGPLDTSGIGPFWPKPPKSCTGPPT